MEAFENIARALPAPLAERLLARSADLRELRLRAGRRARFGFAGGSEMFGEAVSAEELTQIAGALMDYSLYAWENELAQGFFTLQGGCRVGVCGRYAMKGTETGELVQLHGLSIRFAREVRGCASVLADRISQNGYIKSLLIVSRPGMGKTTCLRDLARELSDRGKNVAVADERGEIAALRNGVPALDVGEHTDVMDMCPKHIAIGRLVRAMSPDVIITDELGDARDAQAVLDARRSGVAVIASVHGDSIAGALARPAMCAMREAFDLAALLDGEPGRIAEICGIAEISGELIGT